MSYARPTGLAHARTRRRRRSIIILIVVAVVVGGAFGYAVAYTAGWVPGSRPSALPASCSTSTTKAPQATFVLNVYNSTAHQGDAKSTATALRTRGFNVGVVSNDPYNMKLSGVGQVRFGPAGAALAKQYVAPLIPGVELMQDGRDDNSVDVVLGSNFPTIATQAPTSTTTKPGC